MVVILVEMSDTDIRAIRNDEDICIFNSYEDAKELMEDHPLNVFTYHFVDLGNRELYSF